jgi:two-component system nitrate/nitrite response regulator NarL
MRSLPEKKSLPAAGDVGGNLTPINRQHSLSKQKLANSSAHNKTQQDAERLGTKAPAEIGSNGSRVGSTKQCTRDLLPVEKAEYFLTYPAGLGLYFLAFLSVCWPTMSHHKKHCDHTGHGCSSGRLPPQRSADPVGGRVQSRRCDGIRVAVVDSTRMSSESIASILRRSRCEVTYVGTCAEKARDAFRGADVGLIGSNLLNQVGSGYELAREVHKAYPVVRIVMIIDDADAQSVLRAFQSGARGVFGRNSSPQLIGKCVSRVHEGQIWVSSQEIQFLLEALTAPPRLRLVNSSGKGILSPREQEVVHWLAEGLSNREIADKLTLSENTVKNYLFRIFEKLGISNRVELILYAASQLEEQRSDDHKSNGASNGLGTTKTLEAKIVCEAVEKFASPYYVLGEAYLKGNDVVQDKKSALMWFIVAESITQEFSSKARDAREQLQSELNKRDVAVAQRRAAGLLGKSETRPENYQEFGTPAADKAS